MYSFTFWRKLIFKSFPSKSFFKWFNELIMQCFFWNTWRACPPSLWKKGSSLSKTGLGAVLLKFLMTILGLRPLYLNMYWKLHVLKIVCIKNRTVFLFFLVFHFSYFSYLFSYFSYLLFLTFLACVLTCLIVFLFLKRLKIEKIVFYYQKFF